MLESIREEALESGRPASCWRSAASNSRRPARRQQSGERIVGGTLQVRFLTDLYANWGNHAWTLTLTPIAFEDREPCLNLGPTRAFASTSSIPSTSS